MYALPRLDFNGFSCFIPSDLVPKVSENAITQGLSFNIQLFVSGSLFDLNRAAVSWAYSGHNLEYGLYSLEPELVPKELGQKQSIVSL